MYQIITDMEQADKLWAAGLLYYRFGVEEWSLDDSYLPIYQGPSNMWHPSSSRTDDDAPQYAILLEE